MSEWRLAAAAVVLAGLLEAILPGSALAQQGAPPPAVLVQTVEPVALGQQLEFIGRVAAVDKVELRARVQGFLGPRKFKDGDEVKAGQVLFTIEPEPYEAAVEQKVAQVDAAKAALANSDISLKRAADLLRTNTGTQATYDLRLSEQLQAKAALEDANAQLRDAKIKLSYTEIKSPIDGRAGRSAASPGNLVGPDSGVLVTVVQEQPMRVLFQVTQRELLEARKNDPNPTGSTPFTVRVRLADGRLLDEKGTLDFIDVQVDAKTDGQTVRAVFPNTKRYLTDGQTVRVVIEEEKVPTVLAIQQSAIAIDQTGAYVFVVGDGNKVELRRIRQGVVRDGLASIEEGLKQGEKVIVQGQQRVRPGMVVAPQPAPPPLAKP